MFVWDKEIKEVNDNTITFVDGTEKEFTPKQMEYVMTEEPKDLTQFRNLCAENVANELIEVMKAHNIRKGDMDYIMNLMIASFNHHFYTALGKKFGTYNEAYKFTPQAFEESITMSDLFK